MPMPETTMDEKNRFILRKNQIRCPWKPLIVQPVTEPMREKEFSDNQLGLGILTPYPAHVETSYLFRMYIGHSLSLGWH